MSIENQLGNLAQKLQQARFEAENALNHAQTTLHNRVDGIEKDISADVASLHARIQELEDGIIRHRDQLSTAYADLAARIVAIEQAISKVLP